jgi:hypothetical protein
MEYGFSCYDKAILHFQKNLITWILKVFGKILLPAECLGMSGYFQIKRENSNEEMVYL